MMVHRQMQNGSTDPNQREDGANSSEDPLCGGGFDYIPVQDIDFAVNERHPGLARVYIFLLQIEVRLHYRCLEINGRA